MKRTIQRVVSMVLVGAMTSSVCAFATIINNTAGTISAEESTPLYLHSDSAVFEDAFDADSQSTEFVQSVDGNDLDAQSISADDSTVLTSSLPTVGSVTYTATTMLGDDYGDMSMDISFVIDGNSYTIHPTGDVAKYVLDENYSLLKGSLSDDITISGKQYDASISTNQLVGSPTLNAGIVLTPDDFDTNDNALQIMFHFGTPIMETDAKDAYLSFLGQADDESGDDDTISASENISATVQPQSTVGKLTVVGQSNKSRWISWLRHRLQALCL